MYNNSKELNDWINDLEDYHLPRWEELPDFDIYMDQLITLIDNYLFILKKDMVPIITPSMVNNYVKLKMIPKPNKKKYQRIHLAYLISIIMLKQVLTISEINNGIKLQANISGLRGAYNLFCDEQESAIHKVAISCKEENNPRIIIDDFSKENMAMKLCTFSLATKLFSSYFLETHSTQTK